jgi:competence protein ComEC
MKVRIYFLCFIIVFIVIFLSNKHHAKIIPFYYDQQVSITGIVTEVVPKFAQNRVIIDTEKLSSIHIPEPVHERILITLPPGTTLAPADRVIVHGTLDQPERFVTDTGTQFDYATYLGTSHIQATMYIPEVTVTGQSRKLFVSLQRHLYVVRESLREQIRSIFPLPVSALYSGIMIGDQSLFPPELLDVFRKSGLIHIMVLSGSNIALVAGFVFIFARRLGYYRRYIITGIIVTLFVMMTGFAPPSVRALIMILVTYIARLLLRQYNAMYILLLTILGMLIINPSLARNVSFHLSILATYAILFVAPLIQSRIMGITERFGFREIIAQTLSTQIIVVPYTIVSMGMFSLVGILLNIIVVPLTGLLTVVGYILVGLSYISGSLASILGLPFAYIASFIINISELLVTIPHAVIYTAGLGSVMLGAYYLGLVFIIKKTQEVGQV